MFVIPIKNSRIRDGVMMGRFTNNGKDKPKNIILSHKASSLEPKSDVRLYFLAILPSKKSVIKTRKHVIKAALILPIKYKILIGMIPIAREAVKRLGICL